MLQPGSSQAATYSACAAWLVSGLFEGFNATCLAYGQTGSGKTFTMEGPEREVLAADASLVGVIPRMVTDLFANIDAAQEEEEFTVKVSFVEIYMERIRDLLYTVDTEAVLAGTPQPAAAPPAPPSASQRPATETPPHPGPASTPSAGSDRGTPGLRGTPRMADTPSSGRSSRRRLSRSLSTPGGTPAGEDTPGGSAAPKVTVREGKDGSVFLEGAVEVFVTSPGMVLDVLEAGNASRSVASTAMNARSSRSHSVFRLVLQRKDTRAQTTTQATLFLVDLAGSEKTGKTGATGQTLKEAQKINGSLTALGLVIKALTDGKSSHVPYRDSKLTRLLQDSLGGNARTALIINASPAAYNAEETLSSLRFGQRAKQMKNKPKQNKELSAGALKLMLAARDAEIEALKAQLSGDVAAPSAALEELQAQHAAALSATRAEADGKVAEMKLLVAAAEDAAAAAAAEAEQARLEKVAAEAEAAAAIKAAEEAGPPTACAGEEQLQIEGQVSELRTALITACAPVLRCRGTQADVEVLAAAGLPSDCEAAEAERGDDDARSIMSPGPGEAIESAMAHAVSTVRQNHALALHGVSTARWPAEGDFTQGPCRDLVSTGHICMSALAAHAASAAGAVHGLCDSSAEVVRLTAALKQARAEAQAVQQEVAELRQQVTAAEESKHAAEEQVRTILRATHAGSEGEAAVGGGVAVGVDVATARVRALSAAAEEARESQVVMQEAAKKLMAALSPQASSVSELASSEPAKEREQESVSLSDAVTAVVAALRAQQGMVPVAELTQAQQDKAKLLSALEDRVRRVIELEITLDEARDAAARLELHTKRDKLDLARENMVLHRTMAHASARLSAEQAAVEKLQSANAALNTRVTELGRRVAQLSAQVHAADVRSSIQGASQPSSLRTQGGRRTDASTLVKAWQRPATVRGGGGASREDRSRSLHECELPSSLAQYEAVSPAS